MKIKAIHLSVGDRYLGHEVLSIARGVGGLFVVTTDSTQNFWLYNEQRIEVNDR